jgi:hypothetical protein
MSAPAHLRPSAGEVPLSALKSRHRLGLYTAVRGNAIYRRYVKSVSSSPVTNHSQVDPADQIRTERLGGAHCGHRLLQCASVRSERHDPA